MKETEDILRKQLIDAMENGQYRILLHRTYTEGSNLDEEGTTRNICTKGLKIFEDTNIAFSTSDYKNNIEQILHEIKVAHTYKASDKVFILKVPINAIEYTPGNSIPILYPTNESNQYGNQCYCISPEYVLGYVNVAPDSISSLQYNTLEKQKIDKENLTYTRSITRQYREQNQRALEGIRTDRYYTDAEKRQILQILYAKCIKNGQISRKLQKNITNLMPDVDLKKWGLATSNNLGYHHLVERFLREQKGKKITLKMLEQEFSRTRPVMGKEIIKAIPALINRENETQGISQEDIIQSIANANGFDVNKMMMANKPKISIVEEIKSKIKALFRPKQKLLEEPKHETSTAHKEFMKKYEFKPKEVLNTEKSYTIGRAVEKEGRE